MTAREEPALNEAVATGAWRLLKAPVRAEYEGEGRLRLVLTSEPMAQPTLQSLGLLGNKDGADIVVPPEMLDAALLLLAPRFFSPDSVPLQ